MAKDRVMKPCAMLFTAVVAAVATVGAATGSAAEGYPSRPVTMIVPFPAGGPTDTIARILVEPLRSSLGQPLIIENVSGAGGTIGVGRLARAAPDGYTVGLGIWPTHVLNGAIYSLQYDVVKDFQPIALVATNPQLIVAKKATTARDLGELIVWLRANPGKASAGTVGAGSSQHMSGLLFQQMTGTNFQSVPYRGGAPAIQDLVAGQIDLMFDQASSALPYVRGGAIKSYAVAAQTRLASAPGIPTADEAGLPGFHISVWAGLWAPANTPKEIIGRLNGAVVSALADTVVQQRLKELGQELPTADQQTPRALGDLQKAEIAKWWPIIRAAAIRSE
jgi:tripartite-type tricarboxylate transporter receptor subunit TctC